MKKELLLGLVLLGATIQANEDTITSNQAVDSWCKSLNDNFTQEDLIVMVDFFEKRYEVQDFIFSNPKNHTLCDELYNQLKDNFIRIRNLTITNTLQEASRIFDRYGNEIMKKVELSVQEQNEALLELNKRLTKQCIQCIQKKSQEKENK